jgi:hypothetical protein
MYEYKRLESNNHVRVLILDPSQDEPAPLQCSIKQQELGTTAEPYECISYTWGGKILAHDPYCDDGSVSVSKQGLKMTVFNRLTK